jgi:hypothetical protein
MKKQWIPSVAAVCLFVAVGVLWLRVRELERSVESLKTQSPSAPQVISIGTQESQQPTNSERQNVFRLIDAAKQDNGTTDVGVPWSIEEGMLIDEADRARMNMQHVPQQPVFKNGAKKLIDRTPPNIEGHQFRINNSPAESALDSGTN